MNKHATIGLNVFLISGLCLFLLFGILVITGVFANVLTPGGDDVNFTIGTETAFILTVHNSGGAAAYFTPSSFVVGTITYPSSYEQLIDAGADGFWTIPITNSSVPLNSKASISISVIGRPTSPEDPQTPVTKTYNFFTERINTQCQTNTCNGVFNRYDVNGCPIWRVG